MSEDSSRPVIWGMLSTAQINDAILKGARSSDRVQFLAVASRDLGRAESYANERSIDRAYGSYAELLADPDVEAVYISTPFSLHVEWTIRALEAGKHVLCEKSFTTHSDEAIRAFDVARNHDRLLMEGFMWRHAPQTRRMKELIDGGAIGDLRLIRGVLTYNMLESIGPSDIRFSAELEGGSLADMGCYCVNAARLLAGEPERAYGEQVLGGSGVDLQFYGTLRFADDVIAQIHSSLTTPYRMELEVIGSDGSIYLDDPWLPGLGGPKTKIEMRVGGNQFEVEQIEVEAGDMYRLELENFSDAVRGTAEPLLGRADAVGQARTLEALRQSAVTHQPVAVRA